MYPHRIRLRGPWECAPVGEKPRRTTVPSERADWSEASAPVLLTRSFGYPGRIDTQERVWLTVAEGDGMTITLNGQSLGEAQNAPFEADVTALLGPRNQLEILVRGRRLGEVAMEIRATAFLQGVQVRRHGAKIQVDGTVAGTCDRPLELYLLVDGRNAHYRTVNAGESFTAAMDEDGQNVRVELVHISSVWYVVELPVPVGGSSTP